VPANLIALAREEGGSPAAFLGPLVPWLKRFAAVLIGATALSLSWTSRSVWVFVPVAAAVACPTSS
jgi:hypothetical protein